MAGALKDICARLGIRLIYKTSYDKANRTSLSGKRGIGLDKRCTGLRRHQVRFDLPVLTDVHEPGQCAEVAEVVDVLQIPAFLCRQTDLLVAAAETGAVINVKKGQFLAPWDMKNVLDKLTGSGNANVLLTERGCIFWLQHAGGRHAALPTMAAMGAPVIFDATHSRTATRRAGRLDRWSARVR
jgi:2-dehydro-3-deoxyphosphooctonate aldolase (KDO 8-P synthase)